jgi:hypothetical protein
MNLEWRRGEPIEVRTFVELDAALDAIERDARRTEPVLAFLHGPTGFLTVGVGHPAQSILMHGSRPRILPIRHGVGDEQARVEKKDTPFLLFSAYGQTSKFAKWMGVDRELARAVARFFLERDGALSDLVRWEEEGPGQPSLDSDA